MIAVALNSVPQFLRAQGLPAVSVAFYSDQVHKRTVTPASLKRGTGGRCSFNGIVATVFGATGFLGTSVVNKLGKTGTQLILPYRCDFYDVRRLKLAGDLGQVLFQEFDLRDELAIYNAVKYSNVVINLIGRDWETKNFKFHDVHVDGARRIARIAREAGVERLIHLSSLNVGENIQKVFLKKGSMFLKSKYEGELAVREEFPEATILRPANMYGPGDSFISKFARMTRMSGPMLKYLALWKKGEETIKQPVFFEDVANGIVNAVLDPSSAGKTYQAVGPKRYYLSDLMDWSYLVMRKDSETWGYKRIDMRYDPTIWFRMYLGDYAPGTPIAWMTFDREERDHITDKVEEGLPTLEDLGVKLHDYEDKGPWVMKPLRAYLYYEREYDIYPKPGTLRVAID